MKTTEKKQTPKLVLRWHLSRIYETERFLSDSDRCVHVTVHRSAPPLIKLIHASLMTNLQLESREELDWWNRAEVLEGWVPETALLRCVIERSAVEQPKYPAMPEDRRLAEEMVLLQFLPDDSEWNKRISMVESAVDIPDLTALAELSGSIWLDMTQAARRAAKRRYLKVLGNPVSLEEGGTHETK